jgi:hypothetical protein
VGEKWGITKYDDVGLRSDQPSAYLAPISDLLSNARQRGIALKREGHGYRRDGQPFRVALPRRQVSTAGRIRTAVPVVDLMTSRGKFATQLYLKGVSRVIMNDNSHGTLPVNLSRGASDAVPWRPAMIVRGHSRC